MQSQLEIKGIKKRTTDTVINANKKFGVIGNEVEGHSIGNEYDIEGSDAKKGGDGTGNLVSHLNTNPDFSSGGDIIDQQTREKQLAYTIPGQIRYGKDNIYSDADECKIDTSLNIGQIIIY